MKFIELQVSFFFRRARTIFDAIRASVLGSLGGFLIKRFEIDENILEKITPFMASAQILTLKKFIRF